MDENRRLVITEEVICESFRCYLGKGYYLGVKAQWWAHLIEAEEDEKIKVVRWTPTQENITIAEKLLFDIFLKLDEYDRKVLLIRCGKGFKRSYRRCGKKLGLHHEVFRKEFQQVIEKVQKVLDEE